jgi:hypothetical protein
LAGLGVFRPSPSSNHQERKILKGFGPWEWPNHPMSHWGWLSHPKGQKRN